MKKEARTEAKKMFLKAKGDITNKQIADAVGVNPLTIGRWKRDDKWETELKQAKPAAKVISGVVRKKAARDKAEKLFMELGGNITNKELAGRVDVSPASISKWKELDRWDAKLAREAKKKPIAAKEAAEPDMSQLASPEQIIRINQRIDSLLTRDHLTAAEVAELAAAKRDMLDAVEIYVAIARELGVIKV
jgi:uncharacterized protein YjcR